MADGDIANSFRLWFKDDTWNMLYNFKIMRKNNAVHTLRKDVH